MLAERYKKEVENLCAQLVRAQSYSGNESGALDVLKDYMKKHDFDEVIVDNYGSIIGCVRGKNKGPKILFDGHLDTVPVPDAKSWTVDPFGAQIKNGRMYGRGTSDMKGAVAAMAVAASMLAESTGKNFAGEIYVAGVVHEECFEGIAARAVSQYVKPDVVIIGEASELNMKIGQRGRAEIVAETFGVPAHSANPDKGINAIHLMVRLVEEIDKIPPTTDPILGKGVAVITDIISTPYPGASVVPSHCRATYDRRLLVGETPESVLAPFEDIIKKLTAQDPKFKGKVSYAYGKEACHTGATIEGERFFPGWRFEENEPFIQKTLAGLRAAGFSPEIQYYSFCTNASHYAGEAGIKTFGYGPSKESLAHTIDEYIELDQLYKVTQGYYIISKSLLDIK